MLSKNLQAARERKGLSKSELQRRTGINKRTIEHIEHEIIKNPRIDTLVVLAKELDTTIEDLIK